MANWEQLLVKLETPPAWLHMISEGICETDEFNEVIGKGEGIAVREEIVEDVLRKFRQQLTPLFKYPAPAPGEEADRNFRGSVVGKWNHRCSVRLPYPKAVEEEEVKWKTYLWGIFQNGETAQYAIVLEPTYMVVLDIFNDAGWHVLADYVLDVAEVWRDEVKTWWKDLKSFKRALEAMKEREAKGDPIYTKVREIFSQMRGIKSVEHNQNNQRDPRTVASIILDCKKGSDGRPRVRVWQLKVLGEHDFSDSIALEEGELVYKTAREFYMDQNWAGLRNLFDIDRDWWDRVLKKLCQSRLFGKILEQLETEEICHESIFPQFNNIFSWTRVPGCKPEDVKVIIVGQDPVPDSRATGISFLIEGEEQNCPSINNVFDAVNSSLGRPYHEAAIAHSCPYSWCTQGVLLLNTYMTIGRDQGHRHNKIGWERMTNRILEYFVDNAVDRKLHILLWHAYWKEGAPTHMERLEERAIGDNVVLIPTNHPTARGVKFRTDAPGVFERVDTIRWETIAYGYPTIPPGVIHPPLPTDECSQMAGLTLGPP